MGTCMYCNSEKLGTRRNGPHEGLYCLECGKFQKWVKQAHNIETGEIASDAQQGFAMSLFRKWESKKIPLTKRQAGAIIQVFEE